MSSKAKARSSKRKAETYESEDGFISNDDGKAPKSKKTKTTAKSTSSSKDNAEPMWELDSSKAGMKRATISDFKGNTYINIREYYEKDGQHLPGKKGIMLNLAAYTALVRAIPRINKKLEESGHELDLGGDDGAVEEKEEEEEDEEEDVKSKAIAKRAKPVKATQKSKKANIEATSDEEEEEADDDDD